MSASGIGTSTFVLFLFVLFNVDQHLYEEVVKKEPMGRYLNAFMSTAAVWFEGIFSGFMATFVLLNTIETEKT